MANPSVIPEAVMEFLEANVESIDQVEILRILAEDPRKGWSLATLAKQCQLTLARLIKELATLQSRGFIASRDGEGETEWMYGPRSPEVESSLSQLLRFYNEKPVTLIRFFSSLRKVT